MQYPPKSQIIESVKCSQLIKDKFLSDGDLAVTMFGNPMCWAGGFSLVFQIEKLGQKYAFKVWHTHLDDIAERYQFIKKRLVDCGLPYFLDFDYNEKGLYVDDLFLATHRMIWLSGETLDKFIDKNLSNPDKLFSIATKFLEMTTAFHEKGIAHGDLQHGNIMVTNNEQLVVIDYDSMFVEELVGRRDVIKGLAGYQHPKREENLLIHSKLDHFSELVIYLSLITYAEHPNLWNNDTDRMLFSKEDFSDPDNSIIFNTLLRSSNGLITFIACYLLEVLKLEDLDSIQSLASLLRKGININNPLVQSIADKF